MMRQKSSVRLIMFIALAQIFASSQGVLAATQGNVFEIPLEANQVPKAPSLDDEMKRIENIFGPVSSKKVEAPVQKPLTEVAQEPAPLKELAVQPVSQQPVQPQTQLQVSTQPQVVQAQQIQDSAPVRVQQEIMASNQKIETPVALAVTPVPVSAPVLRQTSPSSGVARGVVEIESKYLTPSSQKTELQMKDVASVESKSSVVSTIQMTKVSLLAGVSQWSLNNASQLTSRSSLGVMVSHRLTRLLGIEASYQYSRYQFIQNSYGYSVFSPMTSLPLSMNYQMNENALGIASRIYVPNFDERFELYGILGAGLLRSGLFMDSATSALLVSQGFLGAQQEAILTSGLGTLGFGAEYSILKNVGLLAQFRYTKIIGMQKGLPSSQDVRQSLVDQLAQGQFYSLIGGVQVQF